LKAADSGYTLVQKAFIPKSEQAENPQKRVGAIVSFFNLFPMRTLRFYFLSLSLLTLALFACNKTDDLAPTPDPVVKINTRIPDASLISIHFGTSTYRGCLYSFSNCIWIGWGAQMDRFENRPALVFDDGAEATQYFGAYFPLTADYTIDQATAAELGIEPQVIKAGWYPARDVASGQATGKRMVMFIPEMALPLPALVNDNNPQNDIGQLHNLAVQVVLHQNRETIKSLKDNPGALRALLTDKLTAFLAEAGTPVSLLDRQHVESLNLQRDFSQYAERLQETSLSASDKKILLEIFNAVNAVPVSTADQLGQFMKIMTEKENELLANTSLNDRRAVLSMVSVLKYSRYYWFWRAQAMGNGGAPEAATIPEWVWADAIGLELGGPLGSALASAIVYADTH
jgi:hypothetical protein